MSPILIVYRRREVTAEVAALLRHFAALGRALVVVTPSAALAAAVDCPADPPIRYLDLSGRTIRPQAVPVSGATSFFSVALSGVKQRLLGWEGARALALWRGVRRDLMAARDLLECEQPAAVIAFEDRTPRPEMCILHAAEDLGIPAVLVPFAASSPESDAVSRADRTAHLVEAAPWRGLKRLLARRLPGQVWANNGQSLLFFSIWDTVALALCGLVRRRPWVRGGSSRATICVFGPREREELRELGIAVDRIAVTGQASLDVLHLDPAECIRRRHTFAAAHDCVPEQPWILCAVPQLAEHDLCSPKEHARATRALFTAMAESGAQVLLSLHPRSRRQDYESMAAAVGATILVEPLQEVLPLCDVFVATYSSTVRWAAMLGIPTVISDLTGLGLTLYDDVSALITVRDPEALAVVLARLIGDATWRSQVGAQLRTQARGMGVIDGGACRRIAAVVDAVSG